MFFLGPAPKIFFFLLIPFLFLSEEIRTPNLLLQDFRVKFPEHPLWEKHAELFCEWFFICFYSLLGAIFRLFITLNFLCYWENLSLQTWKFSNFTKFIYRVTFFLWYLLFIQADFLLMYQCQVYRVNIIRLNPCLFFLFVCPFFKEVNRNIVK